MEDRRLLDVNFAVNIIYNTIDRVRHELLLQCCILLDFCEQDKEVYASGWDIYDTYAAQKRKSVRGNHWFVIPCVPPKRPPFYFLNNCQKLTNFNNFWYVKS